MLLRLQLQVGNHALANVEASQQIKAAEGPWTPACTHEFLCRVLKHPSIYGAAQKAK